MRLVRLPVVLKQTGLSRSTIYARVRDGLSPKPVPLGARAVAWPEAELEIVLWARIAGKTDDEIRRMVGDLVSARTQTLTT